MSFNDDELPDPSANSGPAGRPAPAVSAEGLVRLSVYKQQEEAPLEKNTQMVMLELAGAASTPERAGLDLVVVLDVSGSMEGQKMARLKTAMMFIIRKLGPSDRLSVVTFSTAAARLCPLRFVNDSSSAFLTGLVDGLAADGYTNIRDGLETGLKVVADRRLSAGRVVSVMLMSDGQQNKGGDAAQVAPPGGVPVYTFGFGADHDPKVLQAIADASVGGVYSFVKDEIKISGPYSQPLGGLLTVVVQDLVLTVAPQRGHSAIQRVQAGSYPTKSAGEDGAVTVTFGDVYGREVRSVIVTLVLPAVDEEYDAPVLEVQYAYSAMGKRVDYAELHYVSRSRRAAAEPDASAMNPRMRAELARRQHVDMIREAGAMAEGEKLEDARDKLVEAQNALEDILDQANPMVDMLRAELEQMLGLMGDQDAYAKRGRAYVLAAVTSHDRQRFASRGDADSVRLFVTPRMDRYLEQARRFEEDPGMELPSADDDAKEELAADPLAAVAAPLGFYIRAAIQALQSMERVINAAGSTA